METIAELDKEFSNEFFSLTHHASGWAVIARDREAYGTTASEALQKLAEKIKAK